MTQATGQMFKMQVLDTDAQLDDATISEPYVLQKCSGSLAKLFSEAGAKAALGI